MCPGSDESDDYVDPPGTVDEIDKTEAQRVAESLPNTLIDMVGGLAYLTPSAQELALQAIGPGSRLVLEALEIVTPGQLGGLTTLGEAVVRLLARAPGEADRVVVSLRHRGVRRVGRVVADDDLERAVASTGIVAEQDGQRRATYHLAPEGDQGSNEPGAQVMAAKVGSNVILWQTAGPLTAVTVNTMDELPHGGQPVLIPNPEDLPPSRVLRDHIGLVDPDDVDDEH
ncbi:hypothetical protein GCM10028799_08170 [Kribbella italica]